MKKKRWQRSAIASQTSNSELSQTASKELARLEAYNDTNLEQTLGRIEGGGVIEATIV